MKFSSKTNLTPPASRSKKSLSTCFSKVQYSLSVVARGLFPPAPLMRMSVTPKSFSISSRTASRFSLSRTFVLYAFATPPSATISFATASAASRLRSRSATFAPFDARAFARHPQMTPPAPVMTTTFSFKLMLIGVFIIILPLLGFSFGFFDYLLNLLRVAHTPLI